MVGIPRKYVKVKQGLALGGYHDYDKNNSNGLHKCVLSTQFILCPGLNSGDRIMSRMTPPLGELLLWWQLL